MTASAVNGVFILKEGHFTRYKTETADTEIKISDELNLVSESDEAHLKHKLETFEEITGIVPAVEFTTEGNWQNTCSNIDDYADSEYGNAFSDGDHLLIIYSFGPENSRGQQEFSFAYEVGEDLSKAITERDEIRLKDIFHSNYKYASDNKINIADTTANSFDQFRNELQGKSARTAIKGNKKEAVICLVMLITSVVLIAVAFKTDRRIQGKGRTIN